MKITPGKTYRLRNGQVVKITAANNGTSYIYEGTIPEISGEPTIGNWLKTGQYLSNSIIHKRDIVEEVTQDEDKGKNKS